MEIKKLLWDEKYSVGVEQIDNQHKQIFAMINELFDTINTNTPAERLGDIVEALIKYKTFHFATEEDYFKKFNYEETAQHTEKHREFSEKLTALRRKYPEYTMNFAFELIDFLENWLIDHLIAVDQKYKECFHSHGLKWQ